MKVFVYDKKESKPYMVFSNVKSIEETKEKICFTFPDTSAYEVDKKYYKTTAYQN